MCMNDILVDEQYGLRPNISTEIASYKLITEILVAMNKKSQWGIYFVTWKKAFDCINHTTLLYKIEFYWIVGKFHLLIKSYLNERFQRVLIDNKIAHTQTRNRLKVGFHKVR
jgi:Reverse transcriptase (RNA-dependent DNA polymerase).